MTLQLNVPAIESEPSTPAETRIDDIQRTIEALPENSPDISAWQLIGELALLNRQEFPVSTRLAALELYRQTILDLDRDLSRHYSDQPPPLGEDALLHAELARQLFAELAIGFKQAILALEHQPPSLGRDQQLALSLQRAADALGRQLRVDRLTHTTADAGVWAELHTLYRFSLQSSLQNRDVPDGPGTGSVDHAYKHALLLALVNLAQLPVTNITAVVHYLDRFCDLAQIGPLPIPENTDGTFLINLSADSPAQSLSRLAGHDAPQDLLLLVTHELLQRIHQDASLYNAESAAAPIIPPTDAGYKDLLQHLLQSWGSPPRRLYRRIRKNGIVLLCCSLNAIHHLLSSNHDAATQYPQEGARCTHWLLLNESADGLALNRPNPAEKDLGIGELLALKRDPLGNWGLAVARRAFLGENDTLEVGAQLIAPRAQSVWLRMPQQAGYLPALLLPELPSLHQPATLIVPPGTFVAAPALQLDEAGNVVHIHLQRLVERTPYFERVEFVRPTVAGH